MRTIKISLLFITLFSFCACTNVPSIRISINYDDQKITPVFQDPIPNPQSVEGFLGKDSDIVWNQIMRYSSTDQPINSIAVTGNQDAKVRNFTFTSSTGKILIAIRLERP